MIYSLRDLAKAIKKANSDDKSIPMLNLMHDTTSIARTSYTVEDYKLLNMFERHNITKNQRNIICSEYTKMARRFSIYEIAYALRKIAFLLCDDGVTDYVDEILRDTDYDNITYYKNAVDERYAEIFDSMYNIMLLGDAI